jgi:hypothetical protein
MGTTRTSGRRARSTEQGAADQTRSQDFEPTAFDDETDATDRITAEQLKQLAALAPSLAEPAMGVPTTRLSGEELCRLGQEIYDLDLKPHLEPAHNGEYVVIHVVNGDYFVDADEMRAFVAARKKYPADLFFMRRVGRLDRL